MPDDDAAGAAAPDGNAPPAAGEDNVPPAAVSPQQPVELPQFGALAKRPPQVR